MLGKQCHGTHTSSTSAIFQHCTTHNHPKANLSQFKIIDQDRKQVSREAIHIGRSNPALNCNTGKLNIPKIFNQILGTTLVQIFLQTVMPNKILLPVTAIEPLGQLITQLINIPPALTFNLFLSFRTPQLIVHPLTYLKSPKNLLIFLLSPCHN